MSGLPNCPDDASIPYEVSLGNQGANPLQDQSLSQEEVSASTEADANPDSWRDELAARLQRYRTRRKPRSPRYPSLLLPFDTPESWSRPAPCAATSSGFADAGSSALAPTSPADEQGLAEAAQAAEISYVEHQEEIVRRHSEEVPEPFAKIIEFPRSAAIPVFHPTPLADPIFARPRIVEAPEILPPPPALGGMLIESVEPEAAVRSHEAPFASASASIGRRALAALVDLAVVAVSSAIFGAIFYRLNFRAAPSLAAVQTSLSILALGTLTLAIILWSVYEFSFVVYTGSTLGLRALHLHLAAFDGSPLNRKLRRWRVLASFLSALCVGFGFLWCLLDQDGLCWHDRITRTHVRPLPVVGNAEKPRS